MCGILGFIGSPWAAHGRPAVATLRSRGPDAESVLDLGEAVFAHTRLAVIVAGGIRRRFKTQHQRIEKLRDWRVRCPDKKDPDISARAKYPAVMVRPSCRICAKTHKKPPIGDKFGSFRQNSRPRVHRNRIGKR